MDFIGLLAVVLVYFVLSGRISNLQSEINQLKQKTGTELVSNQAMDASTKAPQFIPQHVTPAPLSPAAAAPQAQAIHTEPNSFSHFVGWMKEDFLVKVGALLLIIAFGWFVSYAFANNWIGPIGRITLGVLAGSIILGLGTWRINYYRHQGGIFVVLGATVVVLTLYAARYIYDFFTPSTALLLMFLAVVYVAFVGVRYKSDNLALAGLVLAGLVPLLTNAPDPSTLGLFSYLLVVVVGTLWVVYLSGAAVLTPASLIIIGFYSIPFLISVGGVTESDRLLGLFFAFVFTIVFFVGNVLSIIFRNNAATLGANILTALGTGVYLISWITFAATQELQSVMYAGWMVIFTIGSYLVYHYARQPVPFYIYAGISIALLAAATAAELGGAVLTIAYTFEIGAILAIAYTFIRDIKILEKLALLFIGPVLLSVQHITAASWRESVVHEDFFVLICLAFVLLFVGMVFLEKQTQPADEKNVSTGVVLSILGCVYTLILIWLSLHALMSQDMATMTSLVVYTILGLITYISGHLNDEKFLKAGGGVLLAFVIGRLLTVDIWSMDITGRIITSFAIGVLLLSTAFIAKQKKTTSSDTVRTNLNNNQYQ